MSSTLLKLPPDVLGTHVLTMLDVVDMVNLDTAACSRTSRRDLNGLFAVAPTIDLRDSFDPSHYRSNVESWKWFWMRNMTIKGIEDHFLKIENITGNLHLVAPPLTIIYDEPLLGTAKIAECSAVISKVDGLILIGQQVNKIAALIPFMTNLTSLVDESTKRSEEDILQLISSLRSLKELKLKSYFGIKLLKAILPMGPTLRSLSICTSSLTEEHYRLIAQHCPHLTTFHFMNVSSIESLPFSRVGASAIAMGCRRLQDVKIVEFSSDREHLLLLFAEHCPELRKIELPSGIMLTDATLNVLARHCPHLEEIDARWNVTSVEVVHNAASLLAQLKKLSLSQNNGNRETISTALRYLRDVESFYLSVWEPASIDAEAVTAVAQRCEQLRSIRVDMGAASIEESVAAIARSNLKLERLELKGTVGMTEALVEAIAESCPRLRVLVASFIPTTPIPSALTDRVVVKLAQSCSKLRIFSGCSGPGMTDVSVLALAEHCRHLSRVDLTHASHLTEGALVRLVERTALVNVQGFNHSTYFTSPLSSAQRARVVDLHKTSDAFLSIRNCNLTAKGLTRIQLTGALKQIQDPSLIEVKAALDKEARGMLPQLEEEQEQNGRTKALFTRTGSLGGEESLFGVSPLILAAGLFSAVMIGSFALLLYKRRY